LAAKLRLYGFAGFGSEAAFMRLRRFWQRSCVYAASPVLAALPVYANRTAFNILQTGQAAKTAEGNKTGKAAKTAEGNKTAGGAKTAGGNKTGKAAKTAEGNKGAN
jgi:hypothetical protein